MERRKCIMRNYEYNVSDIYCQEKVNVPFSWEYKPGLSKVSDQLSKKDTRNSDVVLQPPPNRRRRTNGGSNKVEDEDKDTKWGSLIWNAVESSSMRISSFRSESPKEVQDPFVEAYKNCTRSPLMLRRSSQRNKNNGGHWPAIIMKYMHVLSCKYSADVISVHGLWD